LMFNFYRPPVTGLLQSSEFLMNGSAYLLEKRD
jgi:hypothetical protein